MRSRSRSSRSSTKRRGSCPVSIDPVDRAEHRGGVPRGERVDDLVEQLAVGVAEQRDGALVGRARRAPDPAISWSSTRQRVAHRAAAGAHDEAAARPGATATPSLDAELLHVVLQLGGRHEPERVVVGARADGADDLLGLGRREDELHVLRRLLDDLEQRVEALRRDHVRLVDDEDLVAVAAGPKDARSRRSRASSTPPWLAASISMTSSDAGAAAGQRRRTSRTSPHGVAVGPCSQLRQRARMRALVVLPQPRGPLNR